MEIIDLVINRRKYECNRFVYYLAISVLIGKLSGITWFEGGRDRFGSRCFCMFFRAIVVASLYVMFVE